MATTSPPGVGLLKGLGVTIKHLFKQPATQMYPKQRPDLPPRTRGVIALMDENCTVCMLCARECPDWCIYIDSHKETVPPAKEGGRTRTRNVLDRFAIDFSLCMYCGICVDVCPFDALWWSPEFEYAEYDMGGLLHEMGKLREWMDTVPAPPMLEQGAVAPAEVTDAIAKKQKELEAKAAKQQEAAAAAETPAAKAGDAGGTPKKAEVHVEGTGEIDQETFDKLIAEGKSERIARSKAKAAWVRKEKARLTAEQEASGGEESGDAGDAGAAAAPKAAQVEVEAGQIDQETYDQLIADGKSERMARAKAKAAYVRKERKRLSAEQADGEAAASAAPADDDAPAADDAAADDAPAEETANETPADAPNKKAADVHVEGTGEIDQETFDKLIADGKSERIARSKAKAAWMRKEKQRILDEGGDA
jgi:NADH-quinone oxidoreductase subunit I